MHVGHTVPFEFTKYESLHCSVSLWPMPY
jgi:hypothetical protein